MRKLKLLFAACALLVAAGMQAKTDVTSTYLQDADLASLNGWGNPGRTDWKTDGAVNVVEFWNWSNQFNFSQTAQLPAGYYRLAVNAFYRNSWGGDGTNNNMAWIFAGEKTQNVVALTSMSELAGYAGSNDLYRAATAFSQGKYSNEFDFTVTGEGITGVEIGFKGTCPNGGWCILGPVTLWEYTAEDYIGDYNDKVVLASPLLEKKMNATVLQALTAAIVDPETLTSVDDVQNAVSTLTAAINAANTSISFYESLKSVIDVFDANYAKFDEYGKAAADAAGASDAKTAYDEGTATDGATEKAALNAALRDGVLATKQPGDGLDMTAYITNPDFNSGNYDGWTIETPYGGNCGIQGGSRMEYWAGNASDRSKASFNIYQELTNLPVGAYTISADMYNSTNEEAGAEFSLTCGVYGSSGNEDVALVDIDGTELNTYTTGVVFVINGQLTLGTKNTITPMAARWFLFDNVKLTYARQLTDEEKYNQALAAAMAIAEGTIPATNYTALQALILQNTLGEGATSDEYKAATDALNSAATAAAALVEPYATWKQLCDAGKQIASSEDESVYNAIVFVENYIEQNLVDADALTQANTMATSLTTSYPAWLDLKKSAEVLIAVPNNNAAANAELSGTLVEYSSFISKYEIQSMDDATNLFALIPSATSKVKEAMTEYVTTAEPIDGECFDLTFMIVNPHFTEGEGGKNVATGWTLESGTITEHRLATHNFEAYHMTFNLSQTITGLKKGTYKVTLQGFARHDGDDKDKTNLYCGIVNQPIKSITDEYSTTALTSGKPALGDGNGEISYTLNEQTVYQPNGMSGSYYFFQETNPATNQPFYTNEVQTLITEDGNLKIGFKCETTTDWVIWDNFHLYYYGSAIAVTLDEATGTSYSEDIENANVTLKKTIYEGWNTITVPFAVSDTEVLSGFTFYKYTGDANQILNFEEVTELEPNVPYLLNSLSETNGVGSFSFNGVTVKAADGQTTEGTNYDFVGTYAEATVAEGDYILGEDAFYRSAGGNKVMAYRAYLKKKNNDAGSDGNARLSIAINGVDTSIDTIDGKALNDAAIYNLSGQKVEKAQKGIYIQNGKKMVIK